MDQVGQRKGKRARRLNGKGRVKRERRSGEKERKDIKNGSEKARREKGTDIKSE